jgi:flagellar biosynthetic protein FliR
MGKLSPQLPVMMLTVPMKTLTGFVLLSGSLALWPRFIEARFSGLLDLAERLISAPGQHTGSAAGLGLILGLGR